MDLTLLPLGWLHSLACLLALALGPVILATRKGGVRHRRLGQVYLGAQAALNLSALGIYRLGVFFFPHVLAVVTLAETGRLPVDNPSTHLELTMIHEAMVLEYAGRDLALVELGAQMRLTVLLGLLASLAAPWGIATAASAGAVAVGLLLFAAKVALLGGALAAAEVFWAKVRLFRVPELLAGSFLLALLAVTASYVLGGV